MTSTDLPDVNRDFAAALLAGDLAAAERLRARGAAINRVILTTEQIDRDTFDDTTTHLIMAAARDQAPVVRFLLEHGADPNYAGTFAGRTALLAAARWGHAEVVDVLLAHGVDVDALDRHDRRTSLDYAVATCNAAIVRSLLTGGARGDFRHVGFSVAGGAPAREIVELLVAHGVDINALDDWGRTPLMWAAQYAEVETVERMIALGADVNRVSEANMNGVRSNETALGLARGAKREDVVGVLRRHGAKEGPARGGGGGSIRKRLRDGLME